MTDKTIMGLVDLCIDYLISREKVKVKHYLDFCYSSTCFIHELIGTHCYDSGKVKQETPLISYYLWSLCVKENTLCKRKKKKSFSSYICICLLTYKRMSNAEPGCSERLWPSLEMFSAPSWIIWLSPQWARFGPDELEGSLWT